MLWLKAFHIIAVVTWFAAIFYLPRLFVYHAMMKDETANNQPANNQPINDEISNERFKTMERKLYRGIMTPSMVIVIALGIWMLTKNPDYYFAQGWMHAKLTLVGLLVAYHFYCGALVKKFAADNNDKSHVFYRWFNEAPVFLLVAIVILVVVRPF